jgi:hypothetical protein
LLSAEIQEIGANRFFELVRQISDEDDEPGVRLVHLAVRLDARLVSGHDVPHRHILVSQGVLREAVRRPPQPGRTPRRLGTNDPGLRHPDR